MSRGLKQFRESGIRVPAGHPKIRMKYDRRSLRTVYSIIKSTVPNLPRLKSDRRFPKVSIRIPKSGNMHLNPRSLLRSCHEDK